MKIRVIITGGTIDKSYNMNNGELHFVDSHIPSLLTEGRCRADFVLEKLMLKDSFELTDADRMGLLVACEQADEERIIITHGTDTMVQSARFMQEHLDTKTVVFTGAMIPYVFDKSDALFNLGTAFAAVQCLPSGVYITMNGRVFNANDVVKNREEGAFEFV
ncbi:MAG: asparaginase domain-containing protein [Gammaproteobacteria bacterium]|nr:asparaginase domain-containing protein [Gammaproteobacteria bacterium]